MDSRSADSRSVAIADAEDERLIRSAYAEHGGAVLAYCTRLTGDRATAEDVVQETMLRAWRHADVLVNGAGSVRAWLLTVARNLIVDRARARAARPTEVAADAAPHWMSADPAERVVDACVVADAFRPLTRQQRAVLVQLYVRDRTLRETAVVLGVPVGTVKSRAFTALRVLRARCPLGRPAPLPLPG